MSESSAELADRVLAQRVLAVVRSTDAATALRNARAALDAGLRSIEVTFTTPDATGVIAQLVRDYPDAIIGAGTVLDVLSAQQAMAAGARFFVSPHVAPDVVEFAVANGLPAYPGAGTVTEVISAMRSGAAAVKVFPASAIGPSFIRDTLGPLPDAKLVPTGGIAVGDAPAWIEAGAVAVGLGSGLTKGEPAEVADRVRALLAAVA
ncbi:MAG: bifunctional 4-hydroxy-2-oxoglutarate aldolase/2-dehydro-3-deoxy-phosphogluconate aldolase [Jatrophihabitans sp.]